MAGDALATWIVEFDASGAKAVEGALETLLEHLKGADAAQRTFAATGVAASTAAAKSYGDLTGRVQSLAAAFGVGLGALALFRAGLAGTGEAERLFFFVQQIAREFTSTFLPAIRAVTGALSEILAFFRSLTGAQQELFGKTIMLIAGIKILNAAMAANPILGVVAAVAALAVYFDDLSAILRPIINIFKWFADTGLGSLLIDTIALTALFTVLGNVMVGAFTTASAAVAGMTAEMGLLTAATWLWNAALAVNPVILIAAALAGIIALIAAANKTPKERGQVGSAAGGPEDLEQTYLRIAHIAMNQDLQQQQLQQLQMIAENTRPIFSRPQQGLALI